MDWTWEDNEEWNTVQQNVISQTVVWGALLPFHRDCYYRWISPTKTSMPRVQHFLDFAAIQAGFENPALKASVGPNDAALASRWRLNGKRESTYISWDQDCLLWTFLISVRVWISKEKDASLGCCLPSLLLVTKLISLNTEIICFSLEVLNWTEERLSVTLDQDNASDFTTWKVQYFSRDVAI